MNQSRVEKLLRGQTSLAKKVFGVVPALGAMTANQIRGALESGGASNADVRTIRACLTDLEDAGLVIQQPAGMFRRRPVSVDKEKATAQQTHTIEQKEAEPMNAATQVNALDKLAELSGELAEIAGQLQLRLVRVTTIARELEDVALAVEQERESGAKKSEKLNQLQKLLADLAKG